MKILLKEEAGPAAGPATKDTVVRITPENALEAVRLRQALLKAAIDKDSIHALARFALDVGDRQEFTFKVILPEDPEGESPDGR